MQILKDVLPFKVFHKRSNRSLTIIHPLLQGDNIFWRTIISLYMLIFSIWNYRIVYIESHLLFSLIISEFYFLLFETENAEAVFCNLFLQFSILVETLSVCSNSLNMTSQKQRERDYVGFFHDAGKTMKYISFIFRACSWKNNSRSLM